MQAQYIIPAKSAPSTIFFRNLFPKEILSAAFQEENQLHYTIFCCMIFSDNHYNMPFTS